MADQPVGVAGDAADLDQRGAAAALAREQLDRRGEHAAFGAFAALVLGEPFNRCT